MLILGNNPAVKKYIRYQSIPSGNPPLSTQIPLLLDPLPWLLPLGNLRLAVVVILFPRRADMFAPVADTVHPITTGNAATATTSSSTATASTSTSSAATSAAVHSATTSHTAHPTITIAVLRAAQSPGKINPINQRLPLGYPKQTFCGHAPCPARARPSWSWNRRASPTPTASGAGRGSSDGPCLGQSGCVSPLAIVGNLCAKQGFYHLP